MDTYVNYAARDEAYATPLDQIDVSDPRLYCNDMWYPYFERLRARGPGALHAARARTGHTGRSPNTATWSRSR